MRSILSPLNLACLLLLVLLGSGCSQSSLLTKRDYQKSQQGYLRGDAARALQDFPRRAEHGTFITSMERTYLSLIQGDPQTAQLEKQAAVLEKRVRYHVSREARNFFYVQTPEDYYASEHEVIWMHFLLSWGYSLQGKYDAACVEARIASSLLSLPWSPAGHFDDPLMRIFLAGLWTMCGEWQEARVDLRAAWLMDNRLSWTKELAALDQPPANLFIVLGGPGPEPVWNPELGGNPLRSGRQVDFRLKGRKSPLSMSDDQNVTIKPYLSPDAGKWYERHLARESELHELILDSTYGGKAALRGTLAGSKIAAAAGLGTAVAIGGSALGGAIIYYGTGDAFLYGLTIAVASIQKGMEISRKEYQESTKQFKQELDPSTAYRFVRYLPEYLWMGWSDRTLAYPVKVRTASATVTVRRPSVTNRTTVTIAHLPDAEPSSCGYRINNGTITIVPRLDASGNCPPASSSTVW